MPEYYPAAQTAMGRNLYEALRAWAGPRDDVSVIGGWAVVELVEPAMALQSRDVDLVFRTSDALAEFHQASRRWSLRPAVDKVDRRGIYELVGDPSGQTVVDVFATGPVPPHLFPNAAPVIQKTLPYQGFVPPLVWLLRDKLATIPSRMGTGALDKQEKDLLDIHRLVFHNRDAVPPRRLLDAAPLGLRNEAGGERILRAIRNHPGFAEDYRKLERWLRLH